jgi:hypothetical protein
MPAEDVSEASSSFAVSLASPPQAATADDVGAELANVVSPPHCWLGPSERHIDRTAALRGPLADGSADSRRAQTVRRPGRLRDGEDRQGCGGGSGYRATR